MIVWAERGEVELLTLEGRVSAVVAKGRLRADF